VVGGQIEQPNLLAAIMERLGMQRKRKPLVPPEVHALEQARNELVCAVAYFDCVSEPELVDHAVYMLGASQKKYSYMIARAKENNIRISGLDCLFKEEIARSTASQSEPGV